MWYVTKTALTQFPSRLSSSRFPNPDSQFPLLKMLDAIRSLLAGKSDPTPTPDDHGLDPLHLAACALLLDVAYADGEFSTPERDHLESVMSRHFGLTTAEG